jgi:hypothetical protein
MTYRIYYRGICSSGVDMISVRVRCTVVKALLLSALLRRISLSPKSNLEKFSSFLLIAKPKAFVLLRNRV